MKAIEKVKNCVKEHKEEILVGVITAASFATGYFIGGKMAELAISVGLKNFHERGFIKFFDPEKAVEVTTEEVAKLIQEAEF